jgi:hypothetical protein
MSPAIASRTQETLSVAIRTHWTGRNILSLLLAVSSLCASGSCGAIPNAFALIRASRYNESPQFLAAQGPLSTVHGKDIVAALERQAGKTDILARHLAFEQTIRTSPLIIGNRVTVLENGWTAYPAMLEAIRWERRSLMERIEESTARCFQPLL